MPVMYSFVAREPLTDCRRLLESLEPLEIAEQLKLLPVDNISSKKNKIKIVYIHNPNARFGGKAKVEVTLDRGKNSFRLNGKGPLSFEVRLNCFNDALTIYFVVTGKLIDLVPEEKAREIFNKILDYITAKASTLGLLPRETGYTLISEAPGHETALPVSTNVEPTAIPQQANIASSHEVSQISAIAQQTLGLTGSTPMQETSGTSIEDASCVEKLFTAGLTLDEELSRMIPIDYHYRARFGRLVEDGRADPFATDLTAYRDGYVVRFVAGDHFIESVRVDGRAGIYYRNDSTGETLTGSEALARAEEALCKSSARATYVVIKIE